MKGTEGAASCHNQILKDQNTDLSTGKKKKPPNQHALLIRKTLHITQLPKRFGFVSEPPGLSMEHRAVYSP